MDLEGARAANTGRASIQIIKRAMLVGRPIGNRFGTPFAAITVGAVASRMAVPRQREIAAILRGEMGQLDAALSDAARP